MVVDHCIPAERLRRGSFVRRRFAYGAALGALRERSRRAALRQAASSAVGTPVALLRRDERLRDGARRARRRERRRPARPTHRAPVILFLHNRYRVAGGEERAVDAFRRLVVDELGEDAALLARDSATLGRARAAAALLGGGLAPDDVAAAVRRTGARVVHAHNLTPAFGPRALAAAREAGARVVLHLHNYRLVCAVGTCFTRGEDCTRCHGRATAPGVALGCRGSRAEALVYAGGLAAWQRRIVALADAIIVPSAFAHRRLLELGAPLAGTRVEVLPPPVALAPAIRARRRRREPPRSIPSTATRRRPRTGPRSRSWPPGSRPRRASTSRSRRRGAPASRS